LFTSFASNTLGHLTTPPPRFDLIYLMIDKPDEMRDGRLARHLVSLFGPDAGTQAARSVPARGPWCLLAFTHPRVWNRTGTLIERPMLTAYISYARRNIHPKLTDAAVQDLISAYTGALFLCVSSSV
jgi:DNA replication licensing factor MCM4